MTTVAIAASPARYVAVGNKGPYPIWFSLDGWRWTRSLVMNDPQPRLLTDVVWTGLQFAAVGQDARHQGAVWFSSDGQHWGHNALPLAAAHPTGLAMSTHGLLVWGDTRQPQKKDEAWVLRLDNGCVDPERRAVPPTSLPGVGSRTVVRIQERQNRSLVAYGWEENRPTVWSSIDGNTWRERSGEHVPPTLRCCADPRLHQVAKGPSGWLALGLGPRDTTGPLRLMTPGN